MKQRTNLAEDLINQMFIIAGHKLAMMILLVEKMTGIVNGQ